MKRHQYVAVSMILGLTLFAPGAHADECSDAAVRASNSVFVNRAVSVTGDVIVAEASPGPTLDSGVELSIDRDATITGNAAAESMLLDSGSEITGDVFVDDLVNNGTISGDLFAFTPSSVPPFQAASVRDEAVDVYVAAGAPVILGPGDYGHIEIEKGGTMVFAGGVFNVRSISPLSTPGGQCPFPCRSVLFSAPSDVRVEGRVDTGRDSCVGSGNDSSDCPALGFASGSKNILYVGGANGGDGTPGAQPEAVIFGQSSVVGATIYAANGTVRLHKNTIATGALIGRDVRIDRDGELTGDSFFANKDPVADPQDVSTVDADEEDITGGTSGSTDPIPLVITLSASDPENEDLTFSIVDMDGDPLQLPAPLANGMLENDLTEAEFLGGTCSQSGVACEDLEESLDCPLVGPPESEVCVVNPQTATITYTPDTTDNLEDEFFFLVTDPCGATSQAKVRINSPGDPTGLPPGIGSCPAFSSGELFRFACREATVEGQTVVVDCECEVIARDLGAAECLDEESCQADPTQPGCRCVETLEDQAVTIVLEADGPCELADAADPTACDGVGFDPDLEIVILDGSGDVATLPFTIPGVGTLSDLTAIVPDPIEVDTPEGFQILNPPTRSATVLFTPAESFVGTASFDFQGRGDLDDGGTIDPDVEPSVEVETATAFIDVDPLFTLAEDIEVESEANEVVPISLIGNPGGAGDGGGGSLLAPNVPTKDLITVDAADAASVTDGGAVLTGGRLVYLGTDPSSLAHLGPATANFDKDGRLSDAATLLAANAVRWAGDGTDPMVACVEGESLEQPGTSCAVGMNGLCVNELTGLPGAIGVDIDDDNPSNLYYVEFNGEKLRCHDLLPSSPTCPADPVASFNGPLEDVQIDFPYAYVTTRSEPGTTGSLWRVDISEGPSTGTRCEVALNLSNPHQIALFGGSAYVVGFKDGSSEGALWKIPDLTCPPAEPPNDNKELLNGTDLFSPIGLVVTADQQVAYITEQVSNGNHKLSKWDLTATSASRDFDVLDDLLNVPFFLEWTDANETHVYMAQRDQDRVLRINVATANFEDVVTALPGRASGVAASFDGGPIYVTTEGNLVRALTDDASVALTLEAEGLSCDQQVPLTTLDGADLSNVAVLYIGALNDDDALSPAEDDIQSFVDGGGGLVLEANVDPSPAEGLMSWAPFGDTNLGAQIPDDPSDSATIVDGTHPVLEDLTQSDLEDWAFNTHLIFRNPGVPGFETLATSDVVLSAAGPQPEAYIAVRERSVSAGVEGTTTARFQIEWDLSGETLSAADLQTATVELDTTPGPDASVDNRDTYVYIGTAEQDGVVDGDDFDAPAARQSAAVLKGGIVKGQRATLSIDVEDGLRAALDRDTPIDVFSIQGRVDIDVLGLTEEGRGLQVFTGNPQLAIVTGEPDAPLQFSITAVPLTGIVKDSNLNTITVGSLPYALPDNQVTYTPEQGTTGMFSIEYQVQEGLIVDTGLVEINISDSCAEVGRDPGCAPNQ